MRRDFKRHPTRTLKDYRRHVREAEYARDDPRRVWSFLDCAKKNRGKFANHVATYRIYLYLRMILDMGERGDWDRVAPFAACLRMALYQSQADWGHWTNAVLMMPVAGPVAGEEWGGTPEMLNSVYSY